MTPSAITLMSGANTERTISWTAVRPLRISSEEFL